MIQVPPLVWSFAFDFAAGETRTFAAFRRNISTTDESLSLRGFYQRLAPTLVEHFGDLVEYDFDEVAVPHTLSEEFNRFRDVMISGGTVLRLHELLSEEHKHVKKSRLERSTTCYLTLLTTRLDILVG